MNEQLISAAVVEANRFLAKYAAYSNKREDKSQWVSTRLEHAALHRASMDLTRALAKMRKRD